MSKDGFDPDISHHYETVDLESIIDKDAYMNGFDKDGYDKTGRDEYGIDKNNFDHEGYHRVTNTKFDENNFNKRGFYDGLGFHKVTETKFDENNFDTDKIHKVTGTKFDEEGYDYLGFDEDGWDKDGFDWDCLDKNGFNRYGIRDKFYFDGTHVVTGTKFDEYNFDMNSTHKVTGTKFDEEGYDVEGRDKDRRTKDGYDEYGRDKDGVEDPEFHTFAEQEDSEWDNTDSTDPVFKNESPDPYIDEDYIKDQFGTGKPWHPDDDESDEETRD